MIKHHTMEVGVTMEYTFQTEYNLKAMTALARGLRKTIRRKHSRRSHVLGWIVVVIGTLLMLKASEITLRTVVTALAMGAIVAAFVFEDRLNGAVALKRGLPGLRSSECVFREEGYHSKTELGESTFYYENIQMLAETKDYFILIMSANHGQVYDKSTMEPATQEDFRNFICGKTGKEIYSV